MSRVLEVSTARNCNEDLVSGCFRDIDCFPDQPKEYLGGKDVFEELILLAEESIWITE